ncbi:unnamed protein product, partial [Heterotrigona itama]
DFEGTDVSKKEDTLQGWAEKSVWSMVCAMELGLISNASQNNVLPGTTFDERSHANVAPATVPKSLSLINNSLASAASKSSRIIRSKCRRKKRGLKRSSSRSKSESPFIRHKKMKENFCKARRSYDSATIDSDLNTVDKFWRYESSKNAEQFHSDESRNDDPSVSAGYRDSLAAKRDDNDNLPNQSGHAANILPTRVNIPQTGTSSRLVKSACTVTNDFTSRDHNRSVGTDFETSNTVDIQQKQMVDDCDEDERLCYSGEDHNVSSTINHDQDNVSMEDQMQSVESSNELSETGDLVLQESSSFGVATLLNFDEARPSNFNEAPSSNLSELRSSNLDETASSNFAEAKSPSFGEAALSSFDEGRSSNFDEQSSNFDETRPASSNGGQLSKLDVDELSVNKKISSNEESEPSNEDELNYSIVKKSKVSYDENTTITKPTMKKAVKNEVSRKKGSTWSNGGYELRRITRGSMKVSKNLFVGKLVWGHCSGWWPGENFKILSLFSFFFFFYFNSVRLKED